MTAGWPRKVAAAATLPLAIVIGALAGAAAVVLIGRLLSGIDLASMLGGRLPWYTTRAAAITAYLLLSASTLLGLSISTRALDRLLSRATAFALHEWLSWTALAAVLLHVGALLVDTFQPFSVSQVLVPFSASYRQMATGIGTLSLYLMATITISFYLRSRIGQKAWRTLHFGSFALYVLASVHGIFSGASQDMAWMQWVYIGSTTLVFALLAARILAGKRGKQTRRDLRQPTAGELRGAT
jgi:methionine sulfoxide reductase heme-binding subunit